MPWANFALVALDVADEASAERALARGRAAHLAPGYPFVATADELSPLDAERRGLFVVLAQFAELDPAERTAKDLALPTEIVPLADSETASERSVPTDGNDDEPKDARARAVELFVATPAWSTRDPERVEAELDEALAVHWVDWPHQLERRARALATLTPSCSDDAGRVFSVAQKELYRFSRTYAPVTCGSTRAWVPWMATRLESAVFAGVQSPVMQQVVLVECDSPTVAQHPFAVSPPRAPSRVADGPWWAGAQFSFSAPC